MLILPDDKHELFAAAFERTPAVFGPADVVRAFTCWLPPRAAHGLFQP